MTDVRKNWKRYFFVWCRICGQEAEIEMHLGIDDTDSYYGEIYFKCRSCPGEKVYAEKSEHVIFSFLDLNHPGA